MGEDLESLTLAKLVDFLLSCSAGQREDRTANICGPRPMLKALSWLQKHAQIHTLAPMIQNPLILAFHATEGPVDRREAIPVPLAVIASWERCVCHDSAPDALRLFLGGLLLAAHASLRFGDLQRIQATRLCLTANALRGLRSATKTRPFNLLGGALASYEHNAEPAPLMMEHARLRSATTRHWHQDTSKELETVEVHREPHRGSSGSAHSGGGAV